MADDARPPSGAERLESWKDIAAYLRRDVRTVQRWEQTDGLPIHRHRRAHRPIPYAYKAELDAWWAGRSEPPPAPAIVDAPRSSRRFIAVAAAAVLTIAASAGAYWIARPRGAAAVTASGPAAQKSIAVLPFVDLTEGMKEEEFADGMTEELIDRLSKIPGVRVPAPTSTFYFKNKRVPIADIARTLRVAYVLDGSVRKSGSRLRVAARLIRADNADVVWSETYDRPWTDVLIVQDDIAGEVTRAIASSAFRVHGSGF